MIMIRTKKLFFLLLLFVTGCRPIQAPHAQQAAPIQATATPQAIAGADSKTGRLLEPTGFIQRIHDPAIAKEGATYYIFSTGSRLIVICSEDLLEWRWCGRVFDRNPTWLTDAVPGVGDLWAPDISYFAGKWHLYYAGSTFGSQRSVIGLATNVTLDPERPDYQWTDEGEVIASQPGNAWNAIDPNLFLDEKQQPWLAFGSYWSGIKLRKLDAVTGKLATDDPQLYDLASRANGDGNAIEGAFIVRHGDFYYLFVSFDFCCRGVESTYNVRVGRSLAITGPYVDSQGKPMLEGGGDLLLAAYDRWRGPGHNSILVENGVYWIVYHAYDAQQVGIPKLRVEALTWDDAGWPHAPSAALR